MDVKTRRTPPPGAKLGEKGTLPIVVVRVEDHDNDGNASRLCGKDRHESKDIGNHYILCLFFILSTIYCVFLSGISV